MRLNSKAINWTSNIIYFVIYFIFLCIIFRFFPVWRTGTSTYFSFPASWCLYLVQLIFDDILVLFNNLKRGLSAQMYLYEKKYQAREGARNNIFVSLYGKIPAPSYFFFSVNSYYRYLVVVVVVVYVDMATISWKKHSIFIWVNMKENFNSDTELEKDEYSIHLSIVNLDRYKNSVFL